MSDTATASEIRILSRLATNVVVEIYKRLMGRGPTGVRITVVDNIMYLDIKGALTPLERYLLRSDPGNEFIVKSVRDQIIDNEGKYFIANLRRITGKSDLFYKSHKLDFDFENDRLIGFAIFNQPLDC